MSGPASGAPANAMDLPLRDIHLPPEPSWWPPAPGWWLLAAVLLIAVFLLYRRLRAQALARRARRRVLSQFEAELAQRSDATDRLRCAAAFLRRWQMKTRPDLVALRGEAWLEWLDADAAERPYSQGPGRMLVDALYRPDCEREAADACVALVRDTLARGVPA